MLHLQNLVFVFCNDWQSSILLSAVVLTLLVTLYKRDKSSSKYPSGPLKFPILGNLPQITAAGDFVRFLEKYRKIYGNVYTMEMGGVKRVVISGAEAMHHLLIKNADFTSGRLPVLTSKDWQEQVKKSPGLIWAPYPQWKIIRTQILSVFRQEGMGSARIESKIFTEIDAFTESAITPKLGTPIHIGPYLSCASTNIVAMMVFGKRYDYNDLDFQKFTEASHYTIKASLKGAQLKNIPFFQYLPDLITGERKLLQANEYLVNVAKSWVKSTKKRLNMEEEYCLLTQMLPLAQKEKENEESLYTDDNLALVAYQLCGAGSDTTASALKWALLYMILYPDVQRQVQQEIKDVLGERKPTMKDRLNLPYTDAVIHEVLRCSNVSAISLPHTVERNIIVEGETIPAGAELMFNMASVLWDADSFPEPHHFQPARFLGEDGTNLKSKILIFGLGRRVCPGESLARVEIFLFFVSLLQKYKLSYPPDKKPTLEPFTGLVRTALDYEIIFERF